MSIPHTIGHSHLVKAIQRINLNGVPKRRASTKYDLLYEKDKYPPKYVVSLANTFANRSELHHFSGGKETNNFLIARGFPDIVNKKTGQKVGIEPEDEDDSEFYAEGRVSYGLHRKLERNPKLAKKVKSKRLKEKGDLCCDVCGFSFHERYGAVGIGFIEAHHTVPVSGLKGRRSTKLADMALVCSNCHRMLHRSTPLLSIAELRNRLLKMVSEEVDP